MARPVTEAECARMIELHKEGQSADAIANQLRRSKQTVFDRLVDAGLVTRLGPRSVDESQMRKVAASYRDGLSLRACASKHRLALNTVRNVLLYMKEPLRAREYQRTAGSRASS